MLQRLALVGLVIISILVAGCERRSSETVDSVGPLFEAAFDYSPASSAGVGLDPSQSSVNQYPMAFAVYASSAVIAARRTENDSYRDAATIAADWLVDNSDLNNDDLAGWGLPFAWDASQDGSTNPAHTVYGITTALAVKALLDVYELTGTRQYLDVAEETLDAYSNYYTPVDNRRGYVWYSQWPQDANPFPNVIAMLAGVYARAADVLDREDYKELAMSCAQYLMDCSIDDTHGLHWPYRVGRSKPNDAVHAAYVVEGLLELSAHCEISWDIDSALDYLEQYQDGEMLNRFVGYLPGPARSWGIGYLMYVLCLAGRCDAAEESLLALSTYEFSPGKYGHSPGGIILFPRFHTHILIALAECGF